MELQVYESAFEMMKMVFKRKLTLSRRWFWWWWMWSFQNVEGKLEEFERAKSEFVLAGTRKQKPRF